MDTIKFNITNNALLKLNYFAKMQNCPRDDLIRVAIVNYLEELEENEEDFHIASERLKGYDPSQNISLEEISR